MPDWGPLEAGLLRRVAEDTSCMSSVSSMIGGYLWSDPAYAWVWKNLFENIHL